MRVMRRELDVMTEDDVLQLVVQEPKFQKTVKDRKITKVIYRAEIGCGANITIIAKKNQEQSLPQEEAL